MKRKLRINGHSHLLPYPEEIPEFMKEKEIFWVDDERKHMLQKGWSRPVTHSSFFLDEKLEWMDENKIDHASSKVVIEEFLDGIELSCFVLTDGKHYKILPTAKDYKRIEEGDTGLNTGGMGAISPVPFADDVLLKKIEDRIVKPTVDGLAKDQLPYKGFIFIGLIMVDSEPIVIEYNVRMGDPETEAVLPRLKTDLVEIFQAIDKQCLNEIDIEIDSQTAVTVMLVSGGYPEAYEKGKEITGLDKVEHSIVFHAGANNSDGKIVTSGGRVMSITSFGSDFKSALNTSYKSIELIKFEGMNYRKDIGFDL